MSPERYELLSALAHASRPLTYQELGEILELNPGTVSNSLTRAKRAGLVGVQDGYFFTTEAGIARLEWLDDHVYHPELSQAVSHGQQ